MPGGLAALLDDISAIVKLTAASIDDVGAAAGRAGAKAAGVVVDDTAVTPRYVTGFTPDRELPIIWRIAKGSLRNKLLVILPVAIALSALLPWAITPLLMLGGAYLCFEGAEKVWHALAGQEHSLAEVAAELNSADHERTMVAGAIRTDFILSAEIMAIALAEVAGEPLAMRAGILAVVALAITFGVYGAVGLIVKMDDIGLHMAERGHPASRSTGRWLVAAMPKVMAALSTIGIAAMIWVGGGIIVHGLEVFGVDGPAHLIHDLAAAAGHGVPFADGAVEWIVGAAGAGVVGLAIGGIIAFAYQLVAHRGHEEAAA
jgi:predicted DNA repair protein MutK